VTAAQVPPSHLTFMFAMAPPSATFRQIVQKRLQIRGEHESTPAPSAGNQFTRFDRGIDRCSAQARELANVRDSITTQGWQLECRKASRKVRFCFACKIVL
jgi:hypothetical protein